MAEVEVIVPWRGGCFYRERNWLWVRERFYRKHPRWAVGKSSAATEGPWRKGEALRPGLESSKAEVVVLTDADVWCNGFERAALAVICGAAEWAIPHGLVHRLSEPSTAAVLTGQAWAGLPLEQPPYLGVGGGGALVARRDALLEIPIDRRFAGWGQEDEAHAAALWTLLGEPWRGSADLVHLWHPAQERLERSRGSREGWELRRRYLKARTDQEVMRSLIAEGLQST